MCDFIPYKYRPRKLNTILYNTETRQKLEHLNSNKYLSNMILYGNNGCCKKTFITCYLNNYFNDDNTIYNTTTIDYTLSNNYKITYKVSCRHYQIYLLDNPKNNILILSELLSYLIQSKNILNNNIIIVIHNIEKLQDNLYILKNISEKYNNVKILCTSQKHIKGLTLFIQLRIRNLTYFELLYIAVYINIKENLYLTPNILKNIILNSDNNINNLLKNLQDIANDKSHEFCLLNIVEILKNKDINDYPLIKTKLNNLLIYKSYDISYVINFIFTKIIDYIKNKHDFIYETSHLTKNPNTNNIVKNIILLDTYIFYIYKMIK